jgi:hypothetical protein
MQHIFVSYSRKDSETVDAIVARLRSDGFSVWIDRGSLHVGEQWGTEIVKAVHKAYAFLLMLSPSAVGSTNVRKEVYLALHGNKDILPMKLAPVEIPDSLSYPLADLQWIEYYRDPDATYAELVNVLKNHKPGPTQAMLAVAFVLQGLNRFNPAKQAQLLDSIANFTGIPRAEFEITTPIDMSGHIVVKMPADAAYQLKTAALNCDVRLINYGIKGLRLAGDRDFVLVKSGHFTTLKSGKLGNGWFIGASAIVIALLMSLVAISRAASPPSPPFSTHTPTATNTLTPTPTTTPTITPTSTLRQTPTPQCPILVKVVTHDSCSMGPGPEDKYNVISAIRVGTRVPLIGEGSTSGWFIVLNPIYTNVPCWIRESSLQIPGSNACALDVFTPPASLTPTPENYTITVPVDGSTVQSKPLNEGVTYRITVSGTFSDGIFLADAEYTDAATSYLPMSSCAPSGPPLTDVGVGINDTVNDDNKFPSWGPHNLAHVYTYDYVGEGELVTFNYHDCDYSDNSGSLTIQISVLK